MRAAALSTSAAEKNASGPLPRVLWLSSADSGQGCHHAARSVHRGQHEDRDLPVGLLLVLGVIGPRRNGTFPPDRLLIPENLAGVVVADNTAVLQLHARILGDVVVPDRVLRRPAQRGHHGVFAVVFDPHQRCLAKLAGLGADRGQQDDRLALHVSGVCPTGFGVDLSLLTGPVRRGRSVFTFEWHTTHLKPAAQPSRSSGDPLVTRTV